MADTSIKVRNGVKVFTRMADNAGAVATGIVDVMNEKKEKHPILKERIPMVKEVMASSSNNFIYGKDVFFGNTEAKQATRVLEAYITWADVPEAYILHLSADIGSNSVNFAAGFEELKDLYPWASPFTEAMNEAISKVIDDMDKLIDEEERRVREMAYKNIIKNEIDKKLNEYGEDERTIIWPNEKTTVVKSCLVSIDELSDDVVNIYPVPKFTIEVGDEEGVPLFNVLVSVNDTGRKDPDGNVSIFVKFYDFEHNDFTDYVKIGHGFEHQFPAVKSLLLDIIIPIAKTIIPDLVTLQRAIIDQMINKINEIQGKK